MFSNSVNLYKRSTRRLRNLYIYLIHGDIVITFLKVQKNPNSIESNAAEKEGVKVVKVVQGSF